MKEYKIGEKLKKNYITLIVKESCLGCLGCFFATKINGCSNPLYYCDSNNRSDNKNVIFIEKRK